MSTLVSTRFEQGFYELVIPSFGYSLIAIIEIVVVENQTNGEAFDNECWEICAFSPPLFFGISLYQSFVDILADKRQGLLFKVSGFLNPLGLHLFDGLEPLFLQLLFCFFGCGDSPHLIEACSC